jgi:ribosome recycling factor
VKHVHKLAEEHKVGVREARRDGLAMLKDLEGDGLSSDDRHRADKRIQDLTDEYVKKVDEVTTHKEKEILEV